MDAENEAMLDRAGFAYVTGGWVYLSAPDGTPTPSTIDFWNKPENTFFTNSHWNPFGSYNPSEVDLTNDYCNVWDGSIYHSGGAWFLMFSAVKVENDECWGSFPSNENLDPHHPQRTQFYATGYSLTTLGTPQSCIMRMVVLMPPAHLLQ